MTSILDVFSYCPPHYQMYFNPDNLWPSLTLVLLSPGRYSQTELVLNLNAYPCASLLDPDVLFLHGFHSIITPPLRPSDAIPCQSLPRLPSARARWCTDGPGWCRRDPFPQIPAAHTHSNTPPKTHTHAPKCWSKHRPAWPASICFREHLPFRKSNVRPGMWHAR